MEVQALTGCRLVPAFVPFSPCHSQRGSNGGRTEAGTFNGQDLHARRCPVDARAVSCIRLRQRLFRAATRRDACEDRFWGKPSGRRNPELVPVGYYTTAYSGCPCQIHQRHSCVRRRACSAHPADNAWLRPAIPSNPQPPQGLVGSHPDSGPFRAASRRQAEARLAFGIRPGHGLFTRITHCLGTKGLGPVILRASAHRNLPVGVLISTGDRKAAVVG